MENDFFQSLATPKPNLYLTITRWRSRRIKNKCIHGAWLYLNGKRIYFFRTSNKSFEIKYILNSKLYLQVLGSNQLFYKPLSKEKLREFNIPPNFKVRFYPKYIPNRYKPNSSMPCYNANDFFYVDFKWNDDWTTHPYHREPIIVFKKIPFNEIEIL